MLTPGQGQFISRNVFVDVNGVHRTCSSRVEELTMPTQPRSRQTVNTDPTPDAIRIVPLHVGDTLTHLAAAPAPTAQLTRIERDHS